MMPLLAVEAIEKQFFGVPVLKQVSFDVPAGSTVGLVGENGAGKSTLMNVLGGNLQPDAGRMRIAGDPYAPATPRDAERHGIAFIHQELNLFPNLSVAENICLGALPRRGWLVDTRTAEHRASVLLAEVGLDVPPTMLVERLSAGQRQLVEVAKALNVDARLILLDEPTTSLTSREAAHLFGLMARLRTRGMAMIYISHVIRDVLALCDAIVVLRDGVVVASGPRDAFDEDHIVTLMVGRRIEQLYPSRDVELSPEVVLDVRGVTQPNVVADVSLRLRRGEILGIAGLMGSGRTELARILFGLDPMARGSVWLGGEPIHHLPPRARITRGLAFVTESRRDEGLCAEASIADNITLVRATALARGPLGWLPDRSLAEAVSRARAAVQLTPTALDAHPVRTLSGGNQQKVVLARWLLAEPQVLILDEPTRGIDVGAKVEIYTLMHQLADRGAGVLVISSEIEELLGICDRVLVMRRGAIVDELDRGAFDRERILRAALHAGHVEVS
jgi:ribose transport system ATP-binding protein